jgi:tetracycline repressor-like protein
VLDAASCLPLLEGVFAMAQAEGIAVPGDPTIAANLLLALLNEAGAIIAAAPQDTERRAKVGLSVDLFLTRLFG